MLAPRGSNTGELIRKEELGTLLAREEGKTRAEGIGEATRAGQIFKFFAGECLRLSGETLPSSDGISSALGTVIIISSRRGRGNAF